MIWNTTKVRSFESKKKFSINYLDIIIFFFLQIEMKLYSISCRCSGNYIITEQDLEKGANITGCTNCSLKIHILYEVNDE